MKRTRIAPVSDKRRAKAEAFKPIAAACHERDEFRCQFWSRVNAATRTGLILDAVVAPVPCQRFLAPHHILPQGRGGPDVLDNLVLLCSGPGSHHAFVHEHPLLARQIGLLQ